MGILGCIRSTVNEAWFVGCGGVAAKVLGWNQYVDIQMNNIEGIFNFSWSFFPIIFLVQCYVHSLID